MPRILISLSRGATSSCPFYITHLPTCTAAALYHSPLFSKQKRSYGSDSSPHYKRNEKRTLPPSSLSNPLLPLSLSPSLCVYVKMSRCGSPCGVNGGNATATTTAAAAKNSGGAGEIMLFGVRVTVDSMRKSVSLNNLSQYEQPNLDPPPAPASEVPGAAVGYASADDAVPQNAAATRERKRGVPWTEEEHKLFLLGLQKVGKGDWRGISRNFVKTRTPTQVASHAQKYFLRRSNLNRRRRRSSLFDITTDAIVPMEEDRFQGEKSSPETYTAGRIPVPAAFPVQFENQTENLILGQGDRVSSSSSSSSSKLVRPIAVVPVMNLDLNLKQQKPTSADDLLPLSLNLSLPSDRNSSSARHSAFQAMPSFSNGDSMISVA